MRKFFSIDHPVFIATVLLILTLVYTYPTIFQLSNHLIGGTDDAWIYPWNAFNFREQILSGQDPYYTDFIFAPVGTSLLLHTNSEFNSVFGLMISPWLNEVAQTNLALLLATFLSALGAFLLARETTQSVAGGYFAAIAFAFCPFRILRMAGHMNFATSQWLPFALWSFLKMTDAPKRRYALLTGLFLALSYYSNQYYAIYVILAFFMLFAFGFWKFPEWRSWVLIRNLMLAGGFALLLLLPPAIRFYRDQLEGIRYQHEFGEALAAESSARISDYFRIAPFNHWIQNFLDPQSLDAHAKYTAGWSVLFCGLPGILLAIRNRHSKTILISVVGILFLLLSLGPYIETPWVKIPLPYALLRILPFVNHVRIPSRFAVMVALSMAIAAAYAIGWISVRYRGTQRAVLLALPFSLLLFELFPAPLYMAPFDPPAAFYALREKDDGLMLTLPFYIARAAGSRPMSFQLAHRKKILAGRTARGGPWAVENYFANTPITEFFYKISEGKPRPPQDFSGDQELGAIFRRFLNVRYLTIHPPFSKRDVVIDYVRTVFPDARLLSDEQDIQLYELPPVMMNTFDFASGKAGIRFFLFQNWEPEKKGKRLFLCQKPLAKILLPRTAPEQSLRLQMALRSAEPAEIQFHINARKLQSGYLSQEIQKLQIQIPGEIVTAGHQILTMRFDPPGAIELHSLQAQIK